MTRYVLCCRLIECAVDNMRSGAHKICAPERIYYLILTLVTQYQKVLNDRRIAARRSRTRRAAAAEEEEEEAATQVSTFFLKRKS